MPKKSDETAGLPPATVTLSPIPGDMQSMMSSGARITAEAEKLKVTSRNEYEIADEIAVSLTSDATKIDNFRKSLTRPLDALKAQWIALFKPSIDARLEAAKAIRQKMLGFEREEQEKQRQEQARADAVARKAREEQEKKARAAREEEERLRAEAEQKRQQAERASAAKRAQLEEEARKLEQKAERRAGKAEESEELARMTTSVQVPTREVETSASNKKKTWKARIVDPMAVVKAIAAGQAPISLIEVQQKQANDLARIYKDTSKVPGLEFFEEESFAAKSSRGASTNDF